MGWEIIAPKALVGRKEYLILGLTLTTIFILVFDLFPLDTLLNTSDSSLVNLCVILLIGHVVSLYKKRPAALFEKTTYFVAWLLSTSIELVQVINPALIPTTSLGIDFVLIITVIFFAFVGRGIVSYCKKSFTSR